MGLDMYLMNEQEELGYWRKANSIHNWFVNNVQNGVDDCAEYPVTIEQLKDLLKLVNKVLDNSKLIDGEVAESYSLGLIEDPSFAQEFLPTQEGFFFGNYDYNEYYIYDLKETKKILTKIIREHKDKNSYSYQSSW